MKFIVAIAFALLVSIDPATVRKINAVKAAAEDAFKAGNYLEAARQYRLLVDSLGVREDEVSLNLANALYLAKDTANAVSAYHSASESPKAGIRSKAFQQLGIMANQQNRPEEALAMFKQAIKAEPANDEARYNYEMVKKKLDEKKKQDEQQKQNQDQQKQDQENQDQNKQDQKNQEQKDQEQKEQQKKDQQQQEKDQQEKEEQQQKEQQEKENEQKEQKETDREQTPNLDREKLEQMKISEEKARMILDAMKNQEKQYLQQQKRKPTQSRDRNKPDW